jgi:hypothetical protein
MITLYEIQKKYNATFSQTKRSTIRKLLKSIYNIQVSLSDVSYHLCVLRKKELIRTWERYGRKENGTYYNLPSNRSLTHKGLLYLLQCGIKIAKYLYDWAFNGIKPKKRKNLIDLNLPGNIFFRQERRSQKNPATLAQTLSKVVHALS